jgi:hypothetical protein
MYYILPASSTYYTVSAHPVESAVDLGDQTAEFIPFEVISTAILTYFHLLLGTNVCISVSDGVI